MDVSKFPPESPRAREVRLTNDATIHIGEVRGEARGEARGKAEALLAVLSARGLSVSETHRARTCGCTDSATLDRWIARAVTAASVDEALA